MRTRLLTLLLLTACASTPPRPRAEPPDPEPIAEAPAQPDAPAAQAAPTPQPEAEPAAQSDARLQQPPPPAAADAGPRGQTTEIGIPAAEATLTGALDKELIRRVVRENQRQIRHCYERLLQRNPGLAGRVTVRWRIDADGSVGESEVAESTVNTPALGACLADAVRGWKFPRPKGGGVVRVSYPFVFRLGTGGPGPVEAQDMEAIRRVVAARRNAYAACYLRAAAETPELQGRLQYQWTIAKDGTVSGLALTSDTLRRPDVAACIQEELSGLRFGTRRQPASIRFPFTFPADAR